MEDRWAALAKSIRKPDTVVVNIFGGPGVGKSTTAALTFALLKDSGVNVELVTEYAKDLVWSKRMACIEDQTYIFAKQAHRVRSLLGQVEVVVTDAPIMLSLVYSENEELRALVRATHNSWNTLNYFLERSEERHPFRTEGRTQANVTEARVFDNQIHRMVRENIRDICYVAYEEAAYELHTYVLEHLRSGTEAA